MVEAIAIHFKKLKFKFETFWEERVNSLLQKPKHSLDFIIYFPSEMPLVFGLLKNAGGHGLIQALLEP